MDNQMKESTNDEKIGVSVICNTYNHEKYIAKTLNSILEQRTEFVIEVLVHDDASTDKTADIIRDFQYRFPDIIKPVYQKKNQYSMGVDIIQRYQFPRVKGKYFAFCEGDDYWNDPYKLQKQYDELELHVDIDICAHASYVLNSSKKIRMNDIVPAAKNTIFSMSEVIRGGGGFVATNSLLMRASLLDEQPDFFKKCSLDYSIQMYGALKGGMLYLSDKMSTYRYMIAGSWSDRTEKDTVYKEKQLNIVMSLLRGVDEYTEHQYSQDISMVMSKERYNFLMETGSYRMARHEQKQYFKTVCSAKDKIYNYCMDYCPWFVILVQRISKKSFREYSK